MDVNDDENDDHDDDHDNDDHDHDDNLPLRNPIKKLCWWVFMLVGQFVPLLVYDEQKKKKKGK